MNSIRNRLMLVLLLVISLIGGLTIWGSYRESAHEVEELFDAQLAQSSRVLMSILLTRTKHEDFRSIQEFLDYESVIPTVVDEDDYQLSGKAYHPYERKVAFQLWDSDGRLLLHSGNAGTEPLSPEGLQPDKRGYSDVEKPDGLWRVFSVWDDEHGYLIQMGERYDIRDELVTEIVYHFLAPSLIFLPVLAFLIWWSIGKAMQPLYRLRNAIANRDSKNLDGLSTEAVPVEVLPLVNELNKLFSALKDAFAVERRFTDDAAHEMRTPLSALKTQIQVALRAASEDERRETLEDMVLSVDRMGHMLNQMLTLARLDNTRDINRYEVQLQDMVRTITKQLAAKAESKNIQVDWEVDPEIVLNTEPVSLEILLRNLVDNAIHYTPAGGRVSIAALREPRQVVITVTDNGPGIDPGSYKRVFERYYRKPEQRQNGSGLGLAIAKRCADILQASLELNEAPLGQGLMVSIHLPTGVE